MGVLSLGRGLLIAASLIPAVVRADTPDKPVPARLAELQTTLFDPNARFSISATLAELSSLETGAAAGPDSSVLGRITFLRAFVEYKAKRPEDSIRDGIAALRIDAKSPFLSDSERMHLLYETASQAENSGDCQTAVPYFQQALVLMKSDPASTQGERLGTAERIGYCLHELKRYDEARTLNQATLAGGIALYGADSPKLTTVLTNLAQNTYELKDFAAARGYLQQALAIATKAHEPDKVDNYLFQLGVLAFETHDSAEALRLMQSRVPLAEASGQSDLTKKAKDDLAILLGKLQN